LLSEPGPQRWSVCFFETGSHYVAQVGLEFAVLLPLQLRIIGFTRCTQLRVAWILVTPVLVFSSLLQLRFFQLSQGLASGL
jgi:hypothetical protein